MIEKVDKIWFDGEPPIGMKRGFTLTHTMDYGLER